MSKSNNESQPRALGLFGLTMINIVAIASLRDLPQMATYGIGSIFFYLLAALIFFVPVSLVSAELATAWPERGGVYVWIREAFGETWGFIAVFLQWFQNLCWFPVVLTFGAASLAFAILPEGGRELSESKAYVVSVVLVTYWIAVLLNFRGLSGSSLISIIGALMGVLIPGLLLVGLAGLGIIQGIPSSLLENGDRWIPDMTEFSNVTFAVSVWLAFAGMEMTAAHAREVRSPGRNYPIGTLVSALVIFTVFTLGSLSIATAVSPGQYNLQSGVTEALKLMLGRYGLDELARVIALGMAVGVFGSVNAWILGPSKGLLAAAEDGALPSFFTRVNRKNVPTRILLMQALVVSLICVAFTLQPTVTSAYFMISVLTIQIYLCMYLIMFAAAWRLRKLHPDKKGTFRVPGGKAGLFVVCFIGGSGALFAIALGFFPPIQLRETGIDPTAFITFLGVGLVGSFCLPLLISRVLKRQRQ